jgi:hypothetical protein
VKNALPKDPTKQKLVVKAIAQSLGILPTSTVQRVTRIFPTDNKKMVLSFYERDDISYQMPGKRDTVVVKENGTKTIYQKRILLFNLREVHQMFIQDNPSIQLFSFTFETVQITESIIF